MMFVNKITRLIESAGHELYGKYIKTHPAQIKSGDNFMKWSVKEVKGRGTNYFESVHIKNAKFTINHKDVDKKVRGHDSDGNPIPWLDRNYKPHKTQGQKTPNVYVFGDVEDLDFDREKFTSKLNDPEWTSITYNPHKHQEYLVYDSVPSWWCSVPEFKWELDDEGKNGVDAKSRMKATAEYAQRAGDNVKVLGKRVDDVTTFYADEAILVRHLKCGEDYLIIKGYRT